MSVYSVKGKGWRYDFTHRGIRYTEAWFKTKTAAKEAEAEKRKELKNPTPVAEMPTDMAFLELVNLRLDHVKDYNSEIYYSEYTYKAKQWIKTWGDLLCSQITQKMVELFLRNRRKVSPQTANKEIRYLKATFNYGIKKGLISDNPVDGIEFFPVEKTIKYIPSSEDIDKVIKKADPDTQDYLWTIRETMARVNEINRLKWSDVNFEKRYVVLYTRKKKGGNLTPRKVPMTKHLYQILIRRHEKRDTSLPWVFWHTYWSSKTGEKKRGPFKDRKRIMKSLCEKAGVRYFRYHALRHSGASFLDSNNVPIGSIQRILGHENRTTTEIYIHSISESERDAMALFDRANKKSHTESHTEKKKE